VRPNLRGAIHGGGTSVPRRGIVAEDDRTRRLSLNGRITQLDGLRAIAIIAVFSHHAFETKLTWMGVDLFFILSGFLITDILIRSRDRRILAYFRGFYARRIRRILPPYFLLLAITCLLFGVWWVKPWYYYLGFMNLLPITHVKFPDSLAILWSLAVEEQFYMVWPFIVYFLSERWIARLALFLVILAPLLRWFCTPWFSGYVPIYSETPFRMDLLAIGALVSIVWRNRRTLIVTYGKYGILLSACGLSGFVLFGHFVQIKRTANTPVSNFLTYEFSLVICLGLFVWALSGWRVGVLQSRLLQYIGRISYSLYLIHLTALMVCWKYFGDRSYTSAAVASLIACAYAALSWKYFEQPILRSGHRAQPTLVPTVSPSSSAARVRASL
jgi:peptidoglycan/LPS O-acetylase OafA/YrhL